MHETVQEVVLRGFGALKMPERYRKWVTWGALSPSSGSESHMIACGA